MAVSYSLRAVTQKKKESRAREKRIENSNIQVSKINIGVEDLNIVVFVLLLI